MKTGRLDQEEWKRAQRERWFAEGFKAAREQAVQIVLVVAENEDWRPEEARMAGVKPGRVVRMLKRAADHIRKMPRAKLAPSEPTDLLEAATPEG